MSGQRSADDEGHAESVAAGCSLRETPSRTSTGTAGGQRSTSSTGLHYFQGDGLAVFTWGRGEDGQLGLGDTADQDEPIYVCTGFCTTMLLHCHALAALKWDISGIFSLLGCFGCGCCVTTGGRVAWGGSPTNCLWLGTYSGLDHRWRRYGTILYIILLLCRFASDDFFTHLPYFSCVPTIHESLHLGQRR